MQAHLSPLVAQWYPLSAMEEKLPETLGDRLRAERLRRGLSQERIASYVGKGRSAVNAWENSYNFPELTAFVALAEHFELSTDQLVWGEDVANGISTRVRKIHPILRDGLIARITAEIEKAEAAAALLPEAMKGEHLKDRDERVVKFADANLRRRKEPAEGKAAPATGKKRMPGKRPK